MIFLAVFMILAGLICLFGKYRVVIGGTVCEGEVVRCEYAASSTRGIAVYRYIIGFTYNGEYLEKSSMNSTHAPQKSIGRRLYVYYNAKRPQYIVNRSAGIDLVSLFFIVLPLLAMSI